ncbi:hypothetical protein [Halomonas sp. WWR20]
MTLAGKLLIGQQAITGTGVAIHAVNPATGEPLEPAYAGGSAAEALREGNPLGRKREG